jgi:hypothetical protein
MRKFDFLATFMMMMLFVAMLSLTGCSVPGGQSDVSENNNNQKLLDKPVNKSASFDSSWGSFYDYSGQVELTYYMKSVNGVHNTVTVTVPDDSVCIRWRRFYGL